ncbi:adenine deaminase [Marispirochaeta sp.]|uniref:adenine deaminase n=1 Tax=Marispirochaeta sp. TaxID=2038653 RepID=UPI0029C96A3B|nr:adenine deaminase [Marispirochaeta sp.]
MKRLIDVATGRRKADLVLQNARIVNVHTHEVSDGSLAVDQGVIAGVGAYEGKKELDLNGAYLLPGLIDSHVHIESSLVSPEQFARLVVPRGTTTVIADPHEIANVAGLDGIRYMINAAKGVPLDVYFMLPSCVPSTSFENAGAELDAAALAELINDEAVLGLGEVMDYPSVAAGDAGILAKIALAAERNKPVDGHGPMIEGRGLNAYRAAGIQTDHECSTLDEMRDRLRLGMRILIREGSAARNLSTLIKGVGPHSARYCSFCTDDKQPEEILNEGHIDHNLRLAIENGLDPLTAIQMGTLNAAEGYGLPRKGALVPGFDADLIVVDNLRHLNVQQVYKKGVLVAKNQEALFPVNTPDIRSVSGSVNVAGLSEGSFRLKLKNDLVNVIHLHPGNLITEKAVRKVYVDDQGCFACRDKLDILKLAVIERHKASGNVGLGLVEGFQLKGGALATSIAHDSHNLIVIGDNDRDMLTAAEALISCGGGMCAVKEGTVLDTLPLPIAGLMSNESADQLNQRLGRINRIAYDALKVNPQVDPFMSLSFLALPVIPELKLTDMGLFDVTNFEFIDINAE